MQPQPPAPVPAGRDDIYDASATITITTSSVGQREFAEDGLVIYPLPANNQLTIGGLSPGSEVLLVNTAGQVCLTARAEAPVEILDLEKLRSGLYILNIEQKGAKHLRKIFIE
ncbi:MAG: T9SS type A sorting domain-containing protein [Owenweeksia sp.]|nr:T9SS type A sorting domain-containing protein [Owenweeksia sp.]